jgi:hypothetical protein
MTSPPTDASLAAAANERENLRAVYEQVRACADFDLALRIVAFAPRCCCASVAMPSTIWSRLGLLSVRLTPDV